MSLNLTSFAFFNLLWYGFNFKPVMKPLKTDDNLYLDPNTLITMGRLFESRLEFCALLHLLEANSTHVSSGRFANGCHLKDSWFQWQLFMVSQHAKSSTQSFLFKLHTSSLGICRRKQFPLLLQLLN